MTNTTDEMLRELLVKDRLHELEMLRNHRYV